MMRACSRQRSWGGEVGRVETQVGETADLLGPDRAGKENAAGCLVVQEAAGEPHPWLQQAERNRRSTPGVGCLIGIEAGNVVGVDHAFQRASGGRPCQQLAKRRSNVDHATVGRHVKVEGKCLIVEFEVHRTARVSGLGYPRMIGLLRPPLHGLNGPGGLGAMLRAEFECDGGVFDRGFADEVRKLVGQVAVAVDPGFRVAEVDA